MLNETSQPLYPSDLHASIQVNPTPEVCTSKELPTVSWLNITFLVGVPWMESSLNVLSAWMSLERGIICLTLHFAWSENWKPCYAECCFLPFPLRIIIRAVHCFFCGKGGKNNNKFPGKASNQIWFSSELCRPSNCSFKFCHPSPSSNG